LQISKRSCKTFVLAKEEFLEMFEIAAKLITQVGQSVCAASFLLVLGLLSIVYHQQPALSHSVYLVARNLDDSICYMKTEEGQIINLNKLCSNSTSNDTVLSTLDQQFLENYQRFLSKRSTSLPSVQAALLQLQQAPQTVIQRAQQVCANIRAGMLQNSALESQESADADLINIMALEFYCPDLDE